MILVIDVGNTNTVIGLFQGQELIHKFRISTVHHATADEYGILLAQLLERSHVNQEAITGAILASVVPQLNQVWSLACRSYFSLDLIVVGPGIKTGMPILTDNPAEVGADRIVNAVAAWERFKCPLIVVDFGTATTFDAVDSKGRYLGGAIAAGVEVSMGALFNRAAKLPRVEMVEPSKVIGKNTVHALQSGLFFGYVGHVDELVTRMRAELGGEVKVISTGGLASVFAESSKTIEHVDEFLTLTGLRNLYEMNESSEGTAGKRGDRAV